MREQNSMKGMIAVISVVAGVLVLGEDFSIVYLVGILMILLAIYRMNREA